jgi:hypothetical protein
MGKQKIARRFEQLFDINQQRPFFRYFKEYLPLAECP